MVSQTNKKRGNHEKERDWLKSIDFLASLFPVPEIGVEPTRREALAPETSVSTISPFGLAKAGQR